MRRVIKIGGSLLSRPDFRSAIQSWIDSQCSAQNLCIVGGGQMIDAIRRLDAIHPSDPATVHWLCVDLLQTTFELVSKWFEWPITKDADELQSAIVHGFSTDSPTLIAVRSFYHRNIGAVSECMPHDWRTTTDAIAAYLAGVVEADELVLLKSCDVHPNTPIDELADQGIVDESFPSMAKSITHVRIEQP